MRNYLAQWTRHLSAKDAAAADAAIGVLASKHLLWDPNSPDFGLNPERIAHELARRWRRGWFYWGSNIPPQSWPAVARFDPHFAETAARGWFLAREHLDQTYRQGIHPVPMRLYIKAECWRWLRHDNPEAYVQLLRHPEAVDSVMTAWPRLNFSSPKNGYFQRSWRLPLVIGYLATGQGRRLRDEVKAKGEWYTRTLAQHVEIGLDHPVCDLLLVHEADLEVLHRSATLRASAVIVFSSPGWRAIDTAVEIRSRLSSSCVAFCEDSGSARWVSRFIEELSHDMAFDVACRRATEWGNVIAFSSNDFLGRTQISMERNRMATFGQDNHDLVADLMNLRFDKESRGATSLVTWRREVPPPAPRWIQAQTQEDGKIGRVEPVDHIRPHQRYSLAIWIGPELPGSPVAPPFPDWDLGDGEHDLTVAVAAPGTEFQWTQVPITLPERGKSSVAEFRFKTGASGRVWARIFILHRNRILQTAIYDAQIQDPDVLAPEQGRIALTIESALKVDFRDLEHQPPFALSLMTNKSYDDKKRAFVFTKDGLEINEIGQTSTDALNVLAETIEEFLLKYTSQDILNIKLDPDTALKLAYYGSHATQVLLGRSDRSAWGINRVQVISKGASAAWPVEFFYDGVAPIETAKECSRAGIAKTKGRCPDCDKLEDEKVFCASRLWGLSKIIEREILDDSEPVELSGPTDTASAIVIRKSMVGYSGKTVLHSTGQNELKALEAALAPTILPLVTHWETWQSLGRAEHPDLCILLTHRDKHPVFNKRDALELGDGSWLGIANVPSHVSGQPITMLLGCDTASDAPMSDFAQTFRNAGAPVVVATLSPILARHAPTLANEIVTVLRASQASGEAHTMGWLLREVRQRLLARDIPIGLSIVAFGNTDWRLE